MKSIIYYFSGTGNSLQVARDLSLLLENSTLKSISSTVDMDLSAETIGIVFPVHLWGMPQMIAKFIQGIKVTTSNPYFFAIATYKSEAGDVVGQVQRKMRESGVKLSSGFLVPMPGNNIIYYSLEPLEIREQKLVTCGNQLIQIAQAIRTKQEVMPVVSITERWLKSGLLHTVLTNTFKNSDRQFWLKDGCTGCSICSKACPVDNIRMVNNHPVWQHNCQQCIACINLCPNKAIQYGKTTDNKERYVNPTVKIADFLR